jgi:hypothetical protein
VLKHAMTEKQKFYHLLSLVCEDLPTGAINAAISGGYEANAVQLMHVRQGRIINLAHLVALVTHGLPQFPIPAKLLPAATAARAGTAMSLGLYNPSFRFPNSPFASHTHARRYRLTPEVSRLPLPPIWRGRRGPVPQRRRN